MSCCILFTALDPQSPRESETRSLTAFQVLNPEFHVPRRSPAPIQGPPGCRHKDLSGVCQLPVQKGGPEAEGTRSCVVLSS